MPKLRMVHKGLFLVGIPLLANIAFLAVLMILLQQTDSDLQRELRSRQVVAKAGELTHLYYSSLESIIVGAQTGDPEYIQRYDTDSAALAKSLAELNQLVRPQSQQAELVKHIDASSSQLLSVLSEIRRSGSASLGYTDLTGLKDIALLKHKVSGLVTDLGALAKSETRALEAAPSRVNASRWQVVQFIILCVVGNIIVAVLLAVFFSRTITNGIADLCRDTTRLVREEPLGAVSLASDEIGDLNRILHQVSSALTDARRKERALTTNAADVICSLDEETVFVKLNPACQRVWGYTQDELINRKIGDFVSDVSQVRLNKEITTTFETGFLHKSGTVTDMFWSANWSASDELYFCVARDISEKKQAERLKQQLIDMVSHDLRTPLSSIKSILALFAMQTYGPLTERAMRKIKIAESESGRLIALVNNLLEFERIESGRLALELRGVNCGEVVTRSIDAVNEIASVKEITLVPDIIVDDVVELDENRIVQVLVNLLANAIKFSEEGTTVTVSVRRESDNAVIFKVQDQGRGIAPADQAFLFSRFSQLHQTNASEGAGLGLAICKHIVESHKGKIGVVSEGTNGSCFWFSLPMTKRSESESSDTPLVESATADGMDMRS